jgi:hypothetical protein
MSDAPTGTVFEMDPVTGEVEITRLDRATFQARLMDQVPRVPWLADLPAAMAKGLAYAVVPERAVFPFLPSDLRRPFLFVVGDDLGPLAGGPDRFHRKTLRKALGAACFVGVVPGAPMRTFYGRAIAAALAHRRPAVLVETQPQELGPWLKTLARLAKVQAEVAGEAEGSA